MRGKKTVIASVEDCAGKRDEDPVVTDERTIVLRFPKGQYGYGGYIDWVKRLTPDEARTIGEALVEAADRVEAQA